MIVGSGQFTYRVVAEWAKLPDGWSFKEVGGVGVDRHDNVYVFNRGEHPMIIFDREGNFLRSWGEDRDELAHTGWPKIFAISTPASDRILLVQAGRRVLPQFGERLSAWPTMSSVPTTEIGMGLVPCRAALPRRWGL